MGCENAEISILVTDDEEITQLNRKWLNRNRPTDVLAFSQLEGHPFPTEFIGDVVISAETAKRQAEQLGHSLDRELTRLLVHGILHLLGHEHEGGGPPARRMKAREREILKKLESEEQEEEGS